ncbi:Sterol 3-beta-glucosyltransferase [Chytridiales sp. JEL 0842]|nr:Sterol 3-beta-glucosyltransferase [Chytridiales sp. JEL 0842]
MTDPTPNNPNNNKSSPSRSTSPLPTAITSLFNRPTSPLPLTNNSNASKTSSSTTQQAAGWWKPPSMLFRKSVSTPTPNSTETLSLPAEEAVGRDEIVQMKDEDELDAGAESSESSSEVVGPSVETLSNSNAPPNTSSITSSLTGVLKKMKRTSKQPACSSSSPAPVLETAREEVIQLKDEEVDAAESSESSSEIGGVASTETPNNSAPESNAATSITSSLTGVLKKIKRTSKQPPSRSLSPAPPPITSDELSTQTAQQQEGEEPQQQPSSSISTSISTVLKKITRNSSRPPLPSRSMSPPPRPPSSMGGDGEGSKFSLGGLTSPLRRRHTSGSSSAGGMFGFRKNAAASSTMEAEMKSESVEDNNELEEPLPAAAPPATVNDNTQTRVGTPDDEDAGLLVNSNPMFHLLAAELALGTQKPSSSSVPIALPKLDPKMSSIHQVYRASRASVLGGETFVDPSFVAGMSELKEEEGEDAFSEDEDDDEEEEEGEDGLRRAVEPLKGDDDDDVESSNEQPLEAIKSNDFIPLPPQPESEEESLTVSQKIQLAFELPPTEEYLGEFNCWLIRTLLLRGHMYLTTSHVCFYAPLPHLDPTNVSKAGYLSKRVSKRSVGGGSSVWCVLRGEVLSWYEDSRKLYYPLGTLNLKHAVRVERWGGEGGEVFGIKIVCAKKKSWRFVADTERSQEEWLHLLQTTLLRAHQPTSSLRIVLPLSQLQEIQLTSSTSSTLTDTLRLRIRDPELGVEEEYYFAYFEDVERALHVLKGVWEGWKEVKRRSGGLEDLSIEDLEALKVLETLEPRSSPEKVLGKKNSVAGGLRAIPPWSPSSTDDIAAEKPSLEKRTSAATLRPVPPWANWSLSPPANTSSTTSPSTSPSRPTTKPPTPSPPVLKRPGSVDDLLADPTYPTPSDSSTAPTAIVMPLNDMSPSEVRAAASSTPSPGSKKPLSIVTQPLQQGKEGSKVWNRLNTLNRGYHRKSVSDVGIVERGLYSAAAVVGGGVEKSEEFRSLFALPDEEVLLTTFTCYLVRVLPRLGKLYISENYICFKSKLAGIRTKVIVPISDVYLIQKERQGVFYHGMVIVTKDQNEIFFEFYSSETRNRCQDLILGRVEALKKKCGEEGQSVVRKNSTSAFPTVRYISVLDDIHRTDKNFTQAFNDYNLRSPPLAPTASKSGGSSSPTKTHLPPPFPATLPPKSLHITCLTIGSRGDVQPYIALCKGLLAHGHRPRLATHLEYKEWIESHGIEFREVKGNPAELMQCCVDYGLFTVQFIREASGTLRKWVDELFSSAWEACQGTDVLIESPSAMVGVHIAEALDIPFFGAFPMPWTRTRVYPHPFAVPERGLGGGYNYMTHVMMEQILWKGTCGQVNRFRRNVLNRPPIMLGNLGEHKIPYLYSFSPNVVPPPYDWHDWIHTTGYWFLDNPELNWTPPQSLVDFIKNGEKPVYIGFGSIVVPDADEMTRTIFEAVRRAGVRAIVVEGWSGRMQKKKKSDDGTEKEEVESKVVDGKGMKGGVEVPEYIYLVDKVPHDWLFPQVAGVVHHGGAGTTAAGIRAGVPTAVRPYFGDQYFWADRVQELGIGCSFRKFTKDKLAWALSTITSDPKMRERARLLGEKVRAENGVETAIQCIHRDLDFAHSRIRKLAQYANSGGWLVNTATSLTTSISASSSHATLTDSSFNQNQQQQLNSKPSIHSLAGLSSPLWTPFTSAMWGGNSNNATENNNNNSKHAHTAPNSPVLHPRELEEDLINHNGSTDEANAASGSGHGWGLGGLKWAFGRARSPSPQPVGLSVDRRKSLDVVGSVVGVEGADADRIWRAKSSETLHL